MSQILCSIRDRLRLIDSAHAWKLPVVCISVSVKGRLRTADCRLRTRTEGEKQAGQTRTCSLRSHLEPRLSFHLAHYSQTLSHLNFTLPPPTPVAINVFKTAPIEGYRRSSNLRKFFPRNLNNHVTVRPPVRPSALRIPMKTNFGSTNATRSYRDKKSLRHRETTAKKCPKKLSVMQVFC